MQSPPPQAVADTQLRLPQLQEGSKDSQRRLLHQACLDPRRSISMGSRLPGEGQKGRQPTAPLVTKGAGRGGISGLVGSVPGERLSGGTSPGLLAVRGPRSGWFSPPRAALPGRQVLGQLRAGSTLAWPHTAWAAVGPATDPGPPPQPRRATSVCSRGGECPRIAQAGGGAMRPQPLSARASLHNARRRGAQLRPTLRRRARGGL